MPTVYVKTFGCQMNRADSERILGQLAREGYRPADRPEEADLVLLNTCAIRDKAEQKVLSDLGRLRGLKRERPGLTVGVTGCVAQALGERLLAREPAVDFVVGSRAAAGIPDVLRRVRGGGGRAVLLGPVEEPREWGVQALRAGSVQAQVPVIRGCANRCAYCVVPAVRGPQRSRPAGEVVEEVRDLAARGYKEVVLLGQNVAAYGNDTNDNIGLRELLNLVHEVEGVERIRFMTSHPRDLSDEIIGAVAELPKVCEAVHLPVQSGSDRILAAMNRGYDRALYLERVARLREAVPGVGLSTDVIVGFPGETEEDFAQTLALVEEAGFDRLFGFCFSPRPGTAAARLEGRVAPETAAERLNRLFEVQARSARRRHRGLVGRSLEVLVDSAGPGPGLSGRTRTNHLVHLAGPPAWVGRTVAVRIVEARPHCLLGEAEAGDRA